MKAPPEVATNLIDMTPTAKDPTVKRLRRHGRYRSLRWTGLWQRRDQRAAKFPPSSCRGTKK